MYKFVGEWHSGLKFIVKASENQKYVLLIQWSKLKQLKPLDKNFEKPINCPCSPQRAKSLGGCFGINKYLPEGFLVKMNKMSKFTQY